MRNDTLNIHLKSISELHQAAGLPRPKHPLFSVTRFENFPPIDNTQRVKLISDLYQIALKTECPCKIQYGQTPFDFDEGIISCFAPRQVSTLERDFSFAKSGWLLSVHPDFLRAYPLDKKMKTFGFFDYEVNEALILSEEEQKTIETLFLEIEQESLLPIDAFSQDIIISNLDLMLTYFNRYYNRQFITRKNHSNELISKVEKILNDHFKGENEKSLPTTTSLAAKLNLSPKYLSDCLKQITGQTAQQLIQEKLIEHAKERLTSTGLSVGEIAYQLGFEYPQSFNKFFKNKTNQTPVEYRQFFN